MSSVMRRPSDPAVPILVVPDAAEPMKPGDRQRRSEPRAPAVTLHLAAAEDRIHATQVAPAPPRARPPAPVTRVATAALSPALAWENTSAFLTPGDCSRVSAACVDGRNAVQLRLKAAWIQRCIAGGEWLRAASLMREPVREGRALTGLVSHLQCLAWTPEAVGMLRALATRLDRQVGMLGGRQPLGEAFLAVHTQEARRFAGAIATLRDGLAKQDAIAPAPRSLPCGPDDPIRAFGIEIALTQASVKLGQKRHEKLLRDFWQGHAALDEQECSEQAWRAALADLVRQRQGMEFSVAACDPETTLRTHGPEAFLDRMVLVTRVMVSRRARMHAFMRDAPELLRAVLDLPDAPIALPARLIGDPERFARFVGAQVRCTGTYATVEVSFTIHEDEMHALVPLHRLSWRDAAHSRLSLRCSTHWRDMELTVTHASGAGC